MKHKFLFILLLTSLNLFGQQKVYSIDQLIGNQSSTINSSTNNLQPEVYNSYIKMQAEASKQNINIQIASGFRNFKRQKQIFENKYNKYQKRGLSKTQALHKIVEYSTIPGTSRHHWQTDIDIIQQVKNMPKHLLIPSNYESDGPFCKMKEWMDENAHKYGFYLVYTNDDNRPGFKYEPWHYSYAPISKKLLQQFLKLNNEHKIQPTIDKLGVKIDTVFFKNYIETHIKGINTQLLTL